MSIFKVAIASHLHSSVDYLPPISGETVLPGMRVRVPFGRQKLIGVVMAAAKNSEIPEEKLKPITEILDEQPLLTPSLLALCQKASDYYHHPLGEVILKTLPKIIREGKLPRGAKAWKNEAKPSKQWKIAQPKFQLNSAQENAVNRINKAQEFQTFLLQGVTGSGKTEIYLQTILHAMENNRQALVLVPEIALTPQTVNRFHLRFPGASIAVLHSGLSSSARAKAWLSAARGEANIIIGTRSAIFIPLLNPGIIILDEEHDHSFKQQAGFRYSARDLAVLRGNLENIPIVLGSATPALETMNNARNNKYQLIELPERAGEGKPPLISIVDLRQQKPGELLSEVLLAKMQVHLNQKGQVLLFLNRRGYAPVLMCHQCGDVVICRACDARMVLHQNPKKLICHHCGASKNPPRICENCRRADLFPMGLGTERLEEMLRAHFPNHSILRMDRDNIKTKKELDEALTKIHEKQVDILIGTQMLAKGHHFPALSLVAIVDSDSGFFSADFRGVEKLAQAIVQVAGRAGREAEGGEVLIQTHHPEHPVLNLLLQKGYSAFADHVLKERQNAFLPPFSHMALLRAEAVDREFPIRYLSDLKKQLLQNNIAHVDLWGPIPASMERKSGRYRYHLLLQSAHRGNLQKMLQQLRECLKNLKSSKVRFILDVDPQEVI